MAFTTVSFVATVVIVSGLIAYLGDLLGRRMGKKRLSLFGLRPKHTAIIMTTITGMLIAFLTQVTLLSAFKDLRIVFFKGQKIIRENEAYQKRNQELRESNLRLIASRDALTRDVKLKAAQVEHALREVKAAQDASREAKKLVSTLEARIRSEQVELRSLRNTTRIADVKLKVAAARLQGLSKELSARKLDIVQKDRELYEKKSDLLSKTNELSQTIDQLTGAKQQVDAANKTIDEQLETIKQQKLDLADTAEKLAIGDVVIPQGQELARKVISSSESTIAVRSQVTALLDQAGSAAEKLGAGSDNGGRAIKLVFVDRNNSGWIEDENLCVDAAVKAITEQGTGRETRDILVRVIAVNNTLNGNQSPAVLDLYWNNIAFRRGERIAQRPIDGKLSEGRILLSVMDLLKEDVRTAARNRRVVPVSGPDPEKATQPISEEQLDRIMELVEAIRNQGRQVDVRAVAKTDIFQAGPLTLDNIDFTISTLTRASK